MTTQNYEKINSVGKQLDGTNWVFWKPSMIRLLKLRKAWSSIDPASRTTRSQTLLEEDEERELLAQWLVTSNCTQAINNELNLKTSAKDMWQYLMTRFERKDLAEEQVFRQKITSARQLNKSINEYFEELTHLRLELLGRGGTMSDSELLFHLLAGLDKSYSTIVDVLQASKVSDIVSIKNELERKELLLSMSKGQYDSDEKALFVKTRKKPGVCHFCRKGYHWANECFFNPKSKFFKRELNAEERALVNSSEPDQKDRSEYAASACIEKSGPDRGKWLADSGSSKHFCNDRNSFEIYNEFETYPTFQVADGRMLQAKGHGTIRLQVFKTSCLILRNVWHCPGLEENLFSLTQCEDRGFQIEFRNKTLTLRNNEFLLRIPREGNQYWIRGLVIKPPATCMAIGEQNALLWHKRLGHASLDTLKGIDLAKASTDKLECIDCLEGKGQRQPFHPYNHTVNQILEKVHTDLCGPISPPSTSGKTLFLTITDDKSRKSWVFPLDDKRGSTILDTFRTWQRFAERQTGHNLKCIHSDNGKEYVNSDFKEYCSNQSILHNTTVIYTPQLNGRAERLNRTLMDKVRTMMKTCGMPPQYWAEALLHANNIRNVLPSQPLGGISPNEVWTSERPSLNHIKTFGCQAYYFIHPQLRTEGKLNDRASRAVYLGSTPERAGYKLLDCITGKVVFSRDVVFNEEIYPFKNALAAPNALLLVDKETTTEPTTSTTASHSVPAEINTRNSMSLQSPPNILTTTSNNVQASPQYQEVTVEDENLITSGRFNHAFAAHFRPIGQKTITPKTLAEAQGLPDAALWMEAVKKETESLESNKTWSTVECPKDRKPISSKWLFKVKENPDGTVNKYKARLVAKGFTQKEGIDFEETFAPVIKSPSIRILFAMAAQNTWPIHHLDIKTAFLNGTLDEEIYMTLPEEQSGTTLRLHKSLYGLKQAPRIWYQTLDKALLKLGLHHCVSDHSLYIGYKVILGIYVDDILIFQTAEVTQVEAIRTGLSKIFDLEYLGLVKYFLGIEIHHTSDGIILNQAKYINDLIARFDMQDCIPCSTPLARSDLLTSDPGNFCDDIKRKQYQMMVGSIMYAMLWTRPDLAHAVGILTRYFNAPTTIQLEGAKRVIRYLKRTSTMGLCYKRSKDKAIVGFADASLADGDDAKSTSGYVFKYGNTAITWSSKRQTTVATSSQEAEYIALGSGTKEALWLRSLMGELNEEQSYPTIIYEDNMSAISLAKNPMYHARTKHFNIKHHHIREQILNEQIRVEYIKTKDQCADILTKQLPIDEYRKHCDGLGMFSFP